MTIQKIDAAIDANRRQLLVRLQVKPSDYIGWGNAWNQNLDLWERECGLFGQRGVAQLERDAKAQKAFTAKARRRRVIRAKKCPTCGSSL